jgi:hypothetical protein
MENNNKKVSTSGNLSENTGGSIPNTRKVIVSVLGLATHGKSTVGKRFQGLLPRTRIEVIPMARGVKEAAQRLGWDGRKDAKGRKILQMLGTEVCRTIDDEYWTKEWKANYEKSDAELIICDDMRFENELKCIKEMGGYIIKIKKRMSLWQKFKRKVGLFFGRVHASEVCFNDKEDFCDLVIENYWSMEHIDKQLIDVIERLELRDMQEVDEFLKECEEAEDESSGDS